MRHPAILSILPLLTGCVYLSVGARLPAYDEAMEIGGPERPKLFYADSVDIDSLPTLVPYITISGSATNAHVSKDLIAFKIWRRSVEFEPDVLMVMDGGSEYAGSISAQLSGGIAVSSPIYARILHGICYRIAPARLGFVTDTNKMVLTIDGETDLRAAGLLEGDTILSVDGTSYSLEPQSGFWARALTFKPGDEVKLIWIRPGTGRMEGVATCIPNSSTHLDVSDSVRLSPPPLRGDGGYRDRGRARYADR